MVLNLIINGIPSILPFQEEIRSGYEVGFKPYYKWNTFNTATKYLDVLIPTKF